MSGRDREWDGQGRWQEEDSRSRDRTTRPPDVEGPRTSSSSYRSSFSNSWKDVSRDDRKVDDVGNRNIAFSGGGRNEGYISSHHRSVNRNDGRRDNRNDGHSNGNSRTGTNGSSSASGSGNHRKRERDTAAEQQHHQSSSSSSSVSKREKREKIDDGESEHKPQIASPPGASEVSTSITSPPLPPAEAATGASAAAIKNEEEAEEAKRYAEIAARAEARAKARAEAAAKAAGGGDGQKESENGKTIAVKAEHMNGDNEDDHRSGRNGDGGGGGGGGGLGSINGNGRREPPSLEELLMKKKAEEEARGLSVGKGKLAFKSKKQREQEALANLEEKRKEARAKQYEESAARGMSTSERQRMRDRERDRHSTTSREDEKKEREREKELELIREQYLGGAKKTKRKAKPAEKTKSIFQFDWENTDDTSHDINPLYNQRAQINALFGRGYVAGIDMREQRKQSEFQAALMKKRQAEQRRLEEEDQTLTSKDKATLEKKRKAAMNALEKLAAQEVKDMEATSIGVKGAHWSEKKLEEMGERDWRIFREDFDIRVKGGKAPLPMRYWEEGKLPESVMKAIDDLGYKEPSPIQRMGIPVGMEYRDMIGIAETGSGKTAAFCIPIIAYIKSRPQAMLDAVPDEGPLAMIMAPTRELAQQIEEECRKFCAHSGYRVTSVVGGQSIEDQGHVLRKGIEIVVGTPGRLLDCIENRYLVLNQCYYVVLDEADRMIDMGFEAQVVAVMDAMGGTLKSQDERSAWQEEEKAKKGELMVRVTSMFSATMPAEVERMAQKYLRHPAIVQIGDEDSGKNKRITQKVTFTTEAAKKSQLLDLMRKMQDEKVIVFVNTKKSADILGRQLDQSHLTCAVLHGGKGQDLREQSLEDFRAGEFNVLVATDVASRGLDIPDVAMVVNYELPAKIETYCHRIGRTGRAGKEGQAVSFLTATNEDIMYHLKEYLQSTGAPVPSELAKHAAAQAAPGTRREDGSLVAQQKDKIMFSKK